MDVLTSETCWALNNEIMKQVTSSWSLFIQQSIYYSASSRSMFRVPTTPIIRSTQNCNYSLRYLSYFCAQLPPSNVAKLRAWPRWREVVVTVLCTPDDGCCWHPKHVEWTCRIIDCFVLHLVGQLLIQLRDSLSTPEGRCSKELINVGVSCHFLRSFNIMCCSKEWAMKQLKEIE